jgi:hypothetical protein
MPVEIIARYDAEVYASHVAEQMDSESRRNLLYSLHKVFSLMILLTFIAFAGQGGVLPSEIEHKVRTIHKRMPDVPAVYYV